MLVEIRILGSVAIHGPKGTATPQRDKEKLFRAILAMEPGKPVTFARLLDPCGRTKVNSMC